MAITVYLLLLVLPNVCIKYTLPLSENNKGKPLRKLTRIKRHMGKPEKLLLLPMLYTKRDELKKMHIVQHDSNLICPFYCNLNP